jgi:maltooligosyltrehalose synthase
MYERGDKVGATDAFLTAVVGPDYRQFIAKFLPPGAFELAVADLDTLFQVEMSALQQWRFTAEEATRLRRPVLAVVGTETASIFRESHELIKQWLPQAEELAIPQVTHGLEYMNPRAVADGLALFFGSHKL